MRFSIAVGAVLAVGLAACQSTAPMPSNVFSFDASRQATKDAIVSTFLPKGYQVTKDSDFVLALDRPADSATAQLLFGSGWNETPNMRVVLTITGDKPTRVQSAVQIVTNPGSGIERITDVSNNAEMRAAIVRAMVQVQAALAPS